MFVDQTTVSRAIATIEAVIADVLEDWVPTLDEALHGTTAVVDGSLLPCWSWTSRPDLCSGKHHTTGHNHQFVSTLGGRLVHVSDPLPGSLHDSNAVEKSGVLTILDPSNTLGDKGYLGTGITVPTRKPPGGRLTTEQATLNKETSSLRYVIERSIANFKTWRAVHTDYRHPLSTYPTAFSAIRALYFYSTRFLFHEFCISLDGPDGHSGRKKGQIPNLSDPRRCTGNHRYADPAADRQRHQHAGRLTARGRRRARGGMPHPEHRGDHHEQRGDPRHGRRQRREHPGPTHRWFAQRGAAGIPVHQLRRGHARRPARLQRCG
ncbi:transposase family protein [Frankia sp. Ag45/Mut15]|uniref:Transposase family protein n=1 Tax=Frankia umida TaxID=573489 RepID=A0ABT0K234_9ACTN|nr:transposase family protein [Frankia umida]MCK9877871.1 transposase family protein [Frankia umida]